MTSLRSLPSRRFATNAIQGISQNRYSRDINETLGQLAVDLIAALDNAKTRTQREAIQDAIELLDEMMDRLHDAGVSS